MHRAFARTGLGPVPESPVEPADERVAAAAVRRRLAGALAALPARDRETLLLVAWAELTYEQVAEALDIPIGTVRSRLNRARRRMRRALGDTDPTAPSEEPSHE